VSDWFAERKQVTGEQALAIQAFFGSEEDLAQPVNYKRRGSREPSFIDADQVWAFLWGVAQRP